MKRISPISLLANSYVIKEMDIFKIKKFKKILDMGGTNKLNKILINRDIEIYNANIKNGIDCTKLSYGDNKFDLSVSTAVLEHTICFKKFINESIRVSKFGAIHWFPCGEYAKTLEKFRKKYKLIHDCVIPSINDIKNIVDIYDFNLKSVMNCGTLLIALLYIYDVSDYQIYDFIQQYEDKPYGYLLTIFK